MPLLHLTTFIAAPAERVFDLSLNVQLHVSSMKRYEELPVGGVTTGALKLGDTVTWKARHLFKDRFLKVKITALQRPFSFTDEQVEGDFASMKHEHFFKAVENGTIMIDQFYFESPYGTAGKLFNALWLARYLEKLLSERNAFLKGVAEGVLWKQYL